MARISANIWERFKALAQPERPRTIAEVLQNHGDGTMTVEFLDGTEGRVYGEGHGAGAKVWVEGDRVLTGAPDQTIYNEDV